MQNERFNELLDELDGCSLQTLKEKNARYAKNGDCFHNFRSGAEIMGCTTAQACWRYMAKHLADLRNKIDANDFSNREDFLEKCQDTINYVRFLWCIGNDDPDRENLHGFIDTIDGPKRVIKTACEYEIVEGDDIFCCNALVSEGVCVGPSNCEHYKRMRYVEK